ncbi:MAG TPA: glycosyltransferase family 4 protein [Puia sp.]|nr:glycosyltransferase family 4 protein [Puia sp.]
MSVKPELVMFSQYLLGGGTSFNRNMLACFPRDYFDIRNIYFNPENWNGAKALDIEIGPSDTIFSVGNESVKASAKKLAGLISEREGAIVSNLETELVCLDIHKNPAKTVFFICHDDGFIPLAVKYQSVIDVYISHNAAVHEELQKLLGGKNKDIFFIQHGVKIPEVERSFQASPCLKIVFLARHYKFKGIYDLPVINDLLVKRGVQVDWTVLGDGPERAAIMKQVEHLPNFRFDIPQTTADVIKILREQDVFILPSRADGLPVALLESMSVGCVPVLANFSEGIRKVVTDDIGFVVPVGENEQFADKIATLSADRELLVRLGKNCIEKVKREFDINKQAMEYFNLYKRYKEFKKKRRSGLSDLRRRLRYNDLFNKVDFFIRNFRTRFFSRQATT